MRCRRHLRPPWLLQQMTQPEWQRPRLANTQPHQEKLRQEDVLKQLQGRRPHPVHVQFYQEKLRQAQMLW